MADPDRGFPRAGGALLAGAILVGAIAGAVTGQTSIGILAGFAVGVAAAILVWLIDRRRRSR